MTYTTVLAKLRQIDFYPKMTEAEQDYISRNEALSEYRDQCFCVACGHRIGSCDCFRAVNTESACDADFYPSDAAW